MDREARQALEAELFEAVVLGAVMVAVGLKVLA